MKRILYFDMWSPAGHHVFNNIHIKALSQLGEVYTVFKEGYYPFDFPHVIHYLDVPNSYYKEGEGYYKSRIRLARMIRWVWKRVSKEKWDFIILSSYCPLALYLSGKFKNAIVIDHNTISLLDSNVLGFPFRHLSRGIQHIVFNDYMKTRLKLMGFDNVSIVPHGFFPMNCEDISAEDENRIRQKYSLNPNDKIIFLPSLSISTIDIIGEFIYNEDFNGFLMAHGLKMITKSSVSRSSKSNITIIDGFLPRKDYNYLFLHSLCIVLFYSRDFKYRTSGVLNECFANNIPCVFSDNPALKAYLPYINNEKCVFNDAEGLRDSILSILHTDSVDYYKNLEDLKDPLIAWKQIVG